VTATCNIACRISAYAQLPKAKRGKKATKSRTRTGTLTRPNQPARIRLKISKKAKRGLQQLLKKKHRAVVKVRLGVSGASGGPIAAYTRMARLKQPKKKIARR
jgi:hypothetical protein